jgi:hypothetical protein
MPEISRATCSVDRVRPKEGWNYPRGTQRAATDGRFSDRLASGGLGVGGAVTGRSSPRRRMADGSTWDPSAPRRLLATDVSSDRGKGGEGKP